ncbi:MAG: endonuclease [Bacteroidetes bacterium RIFCSPHIGHO2_02_FULL_44_7]|nr:MAG: endonuclease [Bacteroidetes bacterium RIFCSPHIGHO2_02_FULL_44_7]
MYFVYILQSSKDSSYYIGHAQDLNIRLKRHNDGRVRSTKRKRPWKIIYTQSFHTKQEAYRQERRVKSYKGGVAFKKLIK